jgi:hypothetical protein
VARSQETQRAQRAAEKELRVRIGEATDAVDQFRDVEVDEESGWEVRETKVGEELRFVHRFDVFDGFELNGDLLFDEEIQAEGIGYVQAFVVHGQSDF